MPVKCLHVKTAVAATLRQTVTHAAVHQATLEDIAKLVGFRWKSRNLRNSLPVKHCILSTQWRRMFTVSDVNECELGYCDVDGTRRCWNSPSGSYTCICKDQFYGVNCTTGVPFVLYFFKFSLQSSIWCNLNFLKVHCLCVFGVRNVPKILAV